MIQNITYCFVYLPHVNSVFLDRLPLDPISELDGEVLNYSLNSGDALVLMGDFNAHTASNPPPRISVDTKTDIRGKALLAMCANRGLKILNGSTLANSGPTLVRTGSSTVIDYAITTNKLALHANFGIVDLQIESEHTPIWLHLDGINGLLAPKAPDIITLPRRSPEDLPPPHTN